MQLDNIRVSRKLWFAFLGLMVAMALVSGIAQNRGNTTMARAMDAVVDIDTRAVAWRAHHAFNDKQATASAEAVKSQGF